MKAYRKKHAMKLKRADAKYPWLIGSSFCSGEVGSIVLCDDVNPTMRSSRYMNACAVQVARKRADIRIRAL